MKKQLVHIHGGESFDTYHEYIKYIADFTVDEPTPGHGKKWKDSYELELGNNWQLIRPTMPSPLNSKYAEWVIWFEKYKHILVEGVVLVGHSLGANFLAKYLAENTLSINIAQLHLISGCYGWAGGFDINTNLEGVVDQCDKIYIYHSKDDASVQYSDAKRYKV